MRGKPGYEHLNEPLHVLVEGELPVEVIDKQLMRAREILEELTRPIVSTAFMIYPISFYENNLSIKCSIVLIDLY